MSTTIAAFFATLITTGMTSAVSHEFTLVAGSIASVIFCASAFVHRNVTIYPVFLFGAIALIFFALVSSEANTAKFSSTIHVLCMYMALIGMAASSPDLSGFCQQLMMGTNVVLTASVLHQAYNSEELLKAWQISAQTGGANIMAAQINITLPLVLVRIHESTGQKKIVWLTLLCLNCLAVVLVMSRNGIGAMLIVLTLYLLFNHKRMASLAICAILGVGVSLDSIIQNPFVHHMLVRMRLVGYSPSAPRSLIWRLAMDNIRINPMLGVGPGKPREALSMIDTYHAHNNFVQVALETGIPTGVIFLLMMLLLIWLPGKMIFRSREHFVFTLPIVAYMAYSLTAAPLMFPGSTLLLAVCVHEARVAIKRHHQRVAERRVPKCPPATTLSIARAA